MDNLIYEDPYRQSQFPGNFAHILFAIFFAGLIVGYFLIEQFMIVIIITLSLMAVVGVSLTPTKYQIFNDRIRIALGWIFHFDIPFSDMENVKAGTGKDLRIQDLNFVNSASDDDILRITRKHGAKINITPADRTLFLENINKALTDWRRRNPG